MKLRPSKGLYNMLFSMKRKKYCTARKKNTEIVWRAKIKAYICTRNNNNNNNKKLHIMKTYKFNNQPVFIADTDDMQNVTPLAECNGKGIYALSAYNGCQTLVAADDADFEGDDDVEIVIADCNENRVDDIYTKGYVITNEYYTQLCTDEPGTCLSGMIEDVNLSSNNGMLSKEEYKRLDEKWSATVSKYQEKAAATPYGIPLYDVPTVYTICEELGIKAEC